MSKEDDDSKDDDIIQPPDDDDVDEEEEEEKVSYTRAELDAKFGKARGAGAKKARRELLESLGISSPQEAKKIIEAYNKAQEDELSAVEKANKAQAEALAAKAAADSEAEVAKLEAAILRKLSGGDDPVNPKRLDAAISFAMTCDFDEAETVADMADAAVKHVRDASPEWFISNGDDDGKGKKGGVGKPPGRAPGKGKGPTPDSPRERAKARIAAMQAGNRSPMPK